MSIEEIISVARQAGFPDNVIDVAVSIALAESSGNIYATNKNYNGSIDYGLWQINSIHKPDKSRIFDPLYNAQFAVMLWRRRGNFNDWVTYKKGLHKKYLPSVRKVLEGKEITVYKKDEIPPKGEKEAKGATLITSEILFPAIAGVLGLGLVAFLMSRD